MTIKDIREAIEGQPDDKQVEIDLALDFNTDHNIIAFLDGFGPRVGSAKIFDVRVTLQDVPEDDT